MSVEYVSPLHTFSIDDLTGTFSGLTYADDPSFIDTAGAVMAPITDKDGNVLWGVDSEFGFYVTDFLGAEPKILDGDFGEGHAGNILDPNDPNNVLGISIKNAVTDIFRSALPLGTWSQGLGGTTVKASTEHYNTMADLLSDQAFPNDPNAIAPLDNDLRMLDLRPTGPGGTYEPGLVHQYYVEELTTALQRAIDNNDSSANPISYSDIDFDRDGTNDTFTTRSVSINFDTDGDGVVETIQIGGVDLDNDGTADVLDSYLNGFGGTADLVDLLEPNEATVTYDIAYSSDYSVTLKDDGKLLYRWGTAVKKPNDIRMEVNIALPDEWTADDDNNGVADILENGHAGFDVTRAELVINHDITNNPNDQVRPEDYENEAAIGRLPSYYVIEDPDDATNTLWVSPVDTYNGEGDFLPSYFKLDGAGNIDLGAGGIAVHDPDGNLVGYRNEDNLGNPIGTVLRDYSLADAAAAAGLTFSSSDLAGGFTADWYTTTDREPFEWSYDKYGSDPYKNVFESFRDPADAAAAGYTDADLVSGPRWRLTPNKFGQDLPGLEVPLIPNSQPPFNNSNIKYETGEFTTTTLNLLDWDADADGDGIPDPSPFSHSSGWMMVDPDRLDVNSDGVIDEGWSQVNGTLGAGDLMPTGPILSAVTPNGMNLTQNFFDTAVYVKGDRQDSAKLYDMQLVIEYEGEPVAAEAIGTVQYLDELSHVAKTVDYFDGQVFDAPVVFATPATYASSAIVTVTINNVSSTGITAFVEEADYLDGWHKTEAATMLTLEEGVFDLADGSRLEVGTVDVAAGAVDTFTSVTFSEAFDDIPAILLQLQTNNGADWAVVRADNVSTTGFDVAIQEEEASDGVHAAEVVGWAAIDAQDASGFIQWGDIAAQAYITEEEVSSRRDDFTFDSQLGTNVLVAGSITTYNDDDPVTLRLTNLTDDGSAATAEFLAQEERSLDSETSHAGEAVSGIAFESAGVLYDGGASSTMVATFDLFDFA